MQKFVGTASVSVSSKYWPVVHASDLFYQFATILVSAFFGSKETFSRYGITPECHHVFNVKEIQVDEFVLDLVAWVAPPHTI